MMWTATTFPVSLLNKTLAIPFPSPSARAASPPQSQPSPFTRSSRFADPPLTVGAPQEQENIGQYLAFENATVLASSGTPCTLPIEPADYIEVFSADGPEVGQINLPCGCNRDHVVYVTDCYGRCVASSKKILRQCEGAPIFFEETVLEFKSPAPNDYFVHFYYDGVCEQCEESVCADSDSPTMAPIDRPSVSFPTTSSGTA